MRYGSQLCVTAVHHLRKEEWQLSIEDFFHFKLTTKKNVSRLKFPGGFMKRRGDVPSTDARPWQRVWLTIQSVLCLRKVFRNEVQVINTQSFLAMKMHLPNGDHVCGSSLALSISDIPFDGPIAGNLKWVMSMKSSSSGNTKDKPASSLNWQLAGTKTRHQHGEVWCQKNLSESHDGESSSPGAQEAVKNSDCLPEEIVRDSWKEKAKLNYFM